MTPTFGAPAKPFDCASRFRIGGITIGAGDDADDERDLLTPRRRADELAGLQILQVVVRDRRAREDDGGHEEREGDERRPRVRRRRERRAPARVAQLTIERMPTPETGLFDAPMRPAM